MTSRIDRIRAALADSPGTTAQEHMEYLDEPSGKHDDLMVTSRGLYSMLGAATAETILGKLTAFAETADPLAPIVARVLRWADPPADGINLGDPETREQFAALAAGGVITATERDAVLGLARAKTRAEARGLGAVSMSEIRIALGDT